MRRRRRVSRSAFALCADTLTTGLATWFTLSIRLPQLATGTMSDRETQRMVAEKLLAAAEGAANGSAAMARIALRGSRMPTPLSLFGDGLGVATATSAPARRTVKANAKRLLGKPSGRRR